MTVMKERRLQDEPDEGIILKTGFVYRNERCAFGKHEHTCKIWRIAQQVRVENSNS